MRAAIFTAAHKLIINHWEMPRPAAGEVLVAVRATGVCAGDLYIYQGKNPYAKYPVVGGHEIAGQVEAVGAGVTGLAVGTPVVIEPFLGCGKCYACSVGKSNCCRNLQIIGVHKPGGFAEYVKAPVTHIHRIPAGLSMSTASFAEPVAIGVQACRRGQVSKGEMVVILGCGPIGLALIEVVKALGAHPVATDILPERLTIAQKLGAETLPVDSHLLATILARTNGDGAPVVIEATGDPKAMESTVDLAAAGGRIVIVGLVKQGTMVNLPGLDFTRKEMTVVGSRASVNCFPEALALLASGKISYPKIASEFSLWEAPQVFDELHSRPGAIHKAVLINS